MSLKSQIQEDISNVFLNTDEFAEDVTYVDSANDSHTGKAIVNIQGDSDTEWAGGEVLSAEITMDIAFAGAIKPHEHIIDSENRNWTVTQVKGMDFAAITVAAHCDFKIRS